MPIPRTAAVVVAVALAVGAACVPPAAREQVEDVPGRDLQPTFSPAALEASPPRTTQGDTPGPTPVPLLPPTPDPEAETRQTQVPAASPSPVPADRPFRASAELRDPEGDVDEPLLTDAPAYADLRAGSVEIDGNQARLSVAFATDTPETSDEDHTMNVASFYDVDGDGTIDYEVWANLSSTGWGTSWFDNREGQALFGSDDEVAVEVTRRALLLTFPRHYLGGADTFRWALAAEWGTYDALATGRMTSDQAPDDGQPAIFPS